MAPSKPNTVDNKKAKGPKKRAARGLKKLPGEPDEVWIEQAAFSAAVGVAKLPPDECEEVPDARALDTVPSNIMSLARKWGLVSELGDVLSECIVSGHINGALRNHDVEEIAEFMRSSENLAELYLNFPPVNEEFGRHIFDAIVQNSHIRALFFIDGSGIDGSGSESPYLVPWIGSRNTLVNMTSLQYAGVVAYSDMSVVDCSALFPLLLTSTSLCKFGIRFRRDNGCSDDVMSALLSYLGTASLRAFEFQTHRLSDAAVTALCEFVPLSTVRHFTLGTVLVQQLNLETAAESLAQMILESSLETVSFEGMSSIWNESLISALKRTAPVRNVDFAFTQIGVGKIHLRINRKWNHLILSASTPLALFPHILEKSHASPETSHDSADIVFYVLRQKPDLVPAP